MQQFDFDDGRCKFVGDWKTLKGRGFRYVRHYGITYFYEGIDGDHKYCGVHINKAGGRVSSNQLSEYLYHVFEFITNNLDGEVPEVLYIEESRNYLDIKPIEGIYCPAIYVELVALGTLYEMYLSGEIVHTPYKEYLT
ncbi:hypothetical protein [Vibrio phage RYC]|nr:hypothetical protein [Vibrio phage RYC]